MSKPVHNNQSANRDLELENQRLRQEVQALRQQLAGRDVQLQDDRASLSEKFLRVAIDTIPQSVFWKDRNSVFLGCDRSVAQFAGLESPENIVGKTDYDMPWEPEETEFFRKVDRRVMESGIPEFGIIEPQTQTDGSRHWLETNKVPVRDDNGNVIGLLGTLIDLTQQQQKWLELQQKNDELTAESEAKTKKLQSTELRLQSLADNLPGVIFQYRLEPDGTHSFPYVSEKSWEIYEIESNDFLKAFDVVHPDDIERLHTTIQESAQTLQRFDCEYRIITPSGLLKWVHTISQPVLQDNGDIIWDGIIIDSSSKVKLEQERDRQAQALRSIVEGTVAHTGEEFFRACVKSLAETLDVSYVMIAEIDRSQPAEPRANVIAAWMKTDFSESFQYDLCGTPCNNVFERGQICRYPDSIQALFPKDPYLEPLGAESYVGIPLVNSHEVAVGLIAVLHTEPIAEASEFQASILKIFAARVAAEIERMRTDKALQEKDRILQLTLQAGKLGCWTWNQRTKEVFWSDGVEEILGLEPNSLGRTFEDYLDLIYPEDLDTFQTTIKGALATEQEYRTEHRLVLPNGSIQWIRAQGEIWRDEKGEAIGLLGSVLNDTPNKLAELALVESTNQIQKQARQERLLNQIANQIRTSLDLDRILEATVRQIKQFLGVDRCHFAWCVEAEEGVYWDIIAEARNFDCSDFLGKHPASNFKELSELIKRQEIVRLDDVAALKDLELRQTFQALGNKSMLVLPVQADSGEVGIIACIHHQVVRPWKDEEVEFLNAIVSQVAIAINQADLLAQSQARTRELEALLLKLQQTQAQLIQSEKMSSLGQMVAGVAHEINNPVNFIHGNLVHARQYMEDLLGLCDLYQQHYPDPHPEIRDEIEAIDLEFLTEDMQQLFRSMNVGTDRIGEIIKSLRTFSRLDEAALKDVDLHEGIDSTLMILRTRLRAQGWRPEIEIVKEYGNLPKVECYAGQLNQVFMNLFSNAIDALEMRDRPASQPAWGQIHIKTIQQGDRIVIRIRDNADGMSEETRSNIFNPFFTTKPVGQGTGLGLAIAYQIVTEKHGGTITCDSEIGVGTTFTVSLPFNI